MDRNRLIWYERAKDPKPVVEPMRRAGRDVRGKIIMVKKGEENSPEVQKARLECFQQAEEIERSFRECFEEWAGDQCVYDYLPAFSEKLDYLKRRAERKARAAAERAAPPPPAQEGAGRGSG